MTDREGKSGVAVRRLLETESALELADLELIRCDLQRVVRCCGLVSQEEQSTGLGLELIELAVCTAAITYRRCFSTGVRQRLDRSTVAKVAPDFLRGHDFVIDLANKHIAHSVNAFEASFVSLLVAGSNEQSKILDGPTVNNMALMVSASFPFLELSKLAEQLLDLHVRPRQSVLMQECRQQASKLVGQELAELPEAEELEKKLREAYRWDSVRRPR